MRYALIVAAALALSQAQVSAQAPANAAPAEPPVAATPPPVALVEHSLDDLALLAVQLDGILLSDALEAYQYPGGVLLPLGELCRLVGLGITTDPAQGLATGFIIRESRLFRLSIPAATVTIADRVMPLDPGRVEPQAADIYVDSALLSEWFPLSVQVDTGAMMATVEPREQLPVQARMERERRGAQARTYLPVRDLGYPTAKAPYTNASGPFVDTTLRLTADTHDALDLQYAILATGDVLQTTGEMYLYNETDRLSPTLRLTFSRSDPQGRLFGPLRAHRVAVGDLDASALALVSHSAREPGLLISSFPLNRPVEADQHTFRGNAPPGWDVELCRDDHLIAFSRVGEDGRYEFTDVPLLFGLNRFRLILNGPHGEKREEEIRFNLGDTLTPAGEHEYQLSIQNRDEGGRRSILLDQYGLRPDLSLAAAFASVDLDDGSSHRYTSLQARGYRGPVYGRLHYADDSEGGWAAGFLAQTLLGDATLTAEHYQAHDFTSEVVSPATGAISNHSAVRLDNLRLSRSRSLLPARFSFSHDRQRDGESRSRASLGLYAATRNLRLSHLAEWTRETGAADPTGFRGELLLSRRRGRQYLEGEIDYTLAPSAHLGTIALRSQYYLRDEHTLSLALYRQNGSGTHLSAGLTRRRGNSYWQGFADYDTDGQLTLGVNLSSFFGRDGRSSGWRADSYASASQGAAAARVFLDRNLSGGFDAGDEPLSDIGFFVGEASHPSVTDSQGLAFLGGLSAYQPTTLALNRGSLEDPLWVPVCEGVKLLPRPGYAIPLDFAVIQAGEVSGTIYRERDGVTSPAPGIDLELVDAAGTVVQTQRSAYDGFYAMTAVPGGSYTLRVSPAQTERLGLVPLSLPVVVPPEGGFLDGVDATLTTAGEPAP